MSSKKKTEKKEPAVWEVVVGNIGSVYRGPLYREMLTNYSHYKKMSIEGIGRAAGEQVTAFKDGEIHWEHIPPEK